MKKKAFFNSVLITRLYKSSHYESHLMTLLFTHLQFITKVALNTISQSRVSTFFKQPTALSICIFLFIFFLPISPMSPLQISQFSSLQFDTYDLNQRQYGIGIFSIANIFLLFLVLFFLFQQYIHKKKFIVRHFELPLLLFLLFAHISVLFSINLQTSFVWLLKTYLSMIIYLVFSRMNLNKKQIILILLAFIATIFFEGIIAITQFLKGGMIGIPILENVDTFVLKRVAYSSRGFFSFRAPGTFSHPNLFSNYIALLIPIALVLTCSKNKLLKPIGYISTIVATLTLFSSLSRWGIFSGFCAFFIFLFLLLKIRAGKAFHIIKITLFSLSLVLLLILLNPVIASRFLEFSTSQATVAARITLIEQSFSIIKDSPLFGIGGGTFINYMANYDSSDSEISHRYLYPVHNLYLLLASEIGVLGLFIFLYAITKALYFIFTSLKKISNYEKIIAIGLFTSLITFLLNGLGEPRSFTDRVNFLFWLQLGLLINICRKYAYSKK